MKNAEANSQKLCQDINIGSKIKELRIDNDLTRGRKNFCVYRK